MVLTHGILEDDVFHDLKVFHNLSTEGFHDLYQPLRTFSGYLEEKVPLNCIRRCIVAKVGNFALEAFFPYFYPTIILVVSFTESWPKKNYNYLKTGKYTLLPFFMACLFLDFRRFSLKPPFLAALHLGLSTFPLIINIH
jgi:hypothetical protein